MHHPPEVPLLPVREAGPERRDRLARLVACDRFLLFVKGVLDRGVFPGEYLLPILAVVGGQLIEDTLRLLRLAVLDQPSW